MGFIGVGPGRQVRPHTRFHCGGKLPPPNPRLGMVVIVPNVLSKFLELFCFWKDCLYKRKPEIIVIPTKQIMRSKHTQTYLCHR